MISLFRVVVLAAFAGVFSALTVQTATAQRVSQPAPGSQLRAELLDAARPTFMAETNGAVEFVVRQLNVMDEWAFGEVRLQRPGGGSIDWRRTKYAQDFAQGMFDPSGTFFLLRRISGRWVMIEFATGPTDIAWDSWRTDHKLPPALFRR